MGHMNHIGVTRLGDYVMAKDQDALDEARLIADDLDTEARNSITFQEVLEELADTNPNEQCAFINGLIMSDKLGRWTVEVILTAAFERAVKLKIQEMK
jgi:CRISPR/Cas system-associated protein Csm6